ncbi:MAG: hypothetical protein VYA86_02000 [Candidatus Thermoplasmatota archaeon]|nr:hypothetical protein [Candidatus Thermoplasmatota archaeon]
MGVIDDTVHFGISPTQWWQGDGDFVRWNHTSNSWMDGIESEGQVERVNAQFAGDCHPTPTNCHLYAAYGNTPLHQVDMNGNLVRSWDDSVIEGPIRGIVTWNGEVLFGTEDGVFRYNYSTNTWLTEWTENNGLPNNVQDAVFSMEVIGDDLWIATMATQGWNRNSKILQLNGTSGQWTVHDVGSGQVPEGYGADIGLCDGIVHVAINRWSGWGSQGGVARYDLNSASWLSDWNQGQGGLPHDNPVAIACDEGYDIVYIGFEEDDGSISRYDYVNQQFLAVLDEDDNVISEPIFPGAIHHFGGGLLVGHYDSGGLTFIGTTGQIVTNIIPFSTDAEATSIAPVPGGQAYEFAIGRAGGSSGYNRVDNLDSTGLNQGAWDILATLSTGRVAEITGNSTHVWISPIDDLTSVFGSAILEGERHPNGTIEWTRAWNLKSLVINELFLDGQTLWITTAGLGLVSINLTTSAFSFTGAPLHYQMDEMAMYGNELLVGLMGTAGTAAGIQRFDTSTNTWGTGRIVAGLPSNFVLDFERIGNRVYIATLFGIGVWNLTQDDWEDPMTTADGLPTPFITHLDSYNGVLIIGTPSGLMSFEPGVGLGQLYGRNQGFVGNSVSGIAKVTDPTTGQVNLFVSHNGEGPTRPGFSETTPLINSGQAGIGYSVLDTTLVDILPSNRITALASDWWGVHIATDAEPLMHWNATASEMEQGSSSSGLASWPIQHMDSDGQNVIAISSLGVNRIDAVGALHTSSSLISYAGLNRGAITSSGIYIVGQDGLHVWSGHPSFIEMDRAYMRRAQPLMINFGVGGESLDATNLARPGNQITLINSSNPVTLPEFGNPGPGNILLTQDMLILTSPVSNAATWVSSSRLNYSGTWDLAALNPNLQNSVQMAIENSPLTAEGRSLHIQLQSPQNGTLEVRLTYDWVRSESPSELIEIYDRPQDGGGVLVAQWTVTQDHTFYAYRIYLRPDSNWTSPPTSADLLGSTWDARFSNWQRTSAELETHAGQPLVDGTPYWAVIVIEYPDGSIGEPSMPIGPATPTDEVPNPPSWADAGPLPDELDGEDGDLFVEWAPCTELDSDVTRIWTSPNPITDALGLMDSIEVSSEAGNNTSISLQEGRPYWVALTCVDEGGQHDPANATVIGPVVPTGGIDDFTAPLPVEDIAAWDTPDDEGGQINVSWTPNEEEDCAWYTIFATPAVSETPPVWADDAEIASIIAGCSTNGTTISEIGGQPLVDQQPYWITVVASDKWGNVDHFNITWVSTYSEQNNIGIVPPPRVENLVAWDHPNDTGNAIDVQWTPTDVTDFAFYIVWASEHPLGDVIFKWNDCKDTPSACGLMRITQQSQGFDQPMMVKMESAMYGDSLQSSTPSSIIPNQPLWVTVTIHDVKGNAFLTGLTDHMVMVTPIDNSIDQMAPDRLDEPEVTDRPDDNGDGLLVWYEESDASDIDYYDIYVHDFPFTDASTLNPSIQALRTSSQPIVLERLSNGSEITPNKMLWVAVVPVDTAGNAWTDQLNVATAMAIDNSLEDALYLPEIEGLNASWNEAGTDIIVTWDPSTDSQVEGYLVHFNDQPFVDNRFPVTLATEEPIQVPEITLNATAFDLRNDQLWYISVVVSDGSTNRFGVTPVEVPVWSPSQVDGEGDGDSTEEGSGAWWENLSVLEIALILTLTAMILLLALVLIVRLRKPRYDPLDHATPNWELQVEDWSDSNSDAPLGLDLNFEDTLLPAAARIEASKTAPVSDEVTSIPSVVSTPSTDLDAIAEGLLDDTKPKSKGVDTSFLDDLL